MINQPTPSKGLNIRIPILLPNEGVFFNQGSGLQLNLQTARGASATDKSGVSVPLKQQDTLSWVPATPNPIGVTLG